MPYRWVEPDKFMQHNDVAIYYTYNDDSQDVLLTYRYTTDICERPEFEFDVRDLETGLKIDKNKFYESVQAIVRKAIEMNLLKIPEGDE